MESETEQEEEAQPVRADAEEAVAADGATEAATAGVSVADTAWPPPGNPDEDFVAAAASQGESFARMDWVAVPQALRARRANRRRRPALGRAAAGLVVRCAGRFHLGIGSILAEIYLCHACSCYELLRAETAGQGWGRAGWATTSTTATARRCRLHVLVRRARVA
eukprot:COSAG01_NODE_1024_length_12058_cov_91.598211_8_plen_165_part_00